MPLEEELKQTLEHFHMQLRQDEMFINVEYKALFESALISLRRFEEEKLNEIDFGIELTPLKLLGNWGIKFNYTPGWSYDREMGGDKTIHNVGLKGVYTFGGKKSQLK